MLLSNFTLWIQRLDYWSVLMEHLNYWSVIQVMDTLYSHIVKFNYWLKQTKLRAWHDYYYLCQIRHWAEKFELLHWKNCLLISSVNIYWFTIYNFEAVINTKLGHCLRPHDLVWVCSWAGWDHSWTIASDNKKCKILVCLHLSTFISALILTKYLKR